LLSLMPLTQVSLASPLGCHQVLSYLLLGGREVAQGLATMNLC